MELYPGGYGTLRGRPLARRSTEGSRAIAEDSAGNGGALVKNPLDSLWGTVICGVILTVILYYVIHFVTQAGGVS
jgi:hypothetical protein